MRKLFFLIYIVLIVIASGCKSNSNDESFQMVPLLLKKSTFSGVDEIDTIDAYPEKGLYFLQLRRDYHMGDYSITYGIEKQIAAKPSAKLRYEADVRFLRTIPAKLDLWYRCDKDYLLLMDRELSDIGHGWFRMENGRKLGWDIQEDRLLEIWDSFQKSGTGHYWYHASSSGMAKIYRNDTLIYQVHNDSLRAKYKESNYAGLSRGLYKRINDSLVLVSKDPDDLFKREDGIYFLPFPGHGVRNWYLKKEIFRLVDSVSKASLHPDELIVQPVQ